MKLKNLLLLSTFLLQTTLLFADVTGHIFDDVNSNGFFDDGEQAQTFKIVYLYNGKAEPSNLIAQTYTNYNGFYQFNNLESGYYTLITNGVSNACNTKNYFDLGSGTYQLNFTTTCSETDCCKGSFYEFTNSHVNEGFSQVNCDGTVTIAPQGLSPCHQVTISWKDGETNGPFKVGDFPLNFPSNNFNEVLMLVDELNNYGQICFSDEISEPINFDNCGGCNSCYAEVAFTTSQLEGQPNVIQFENLSILENQCDFTTFNWVFGDGLFSIDKNPVHTYSTDGLFEVCLTATYTSPAQSVCETVICDEIEIEPPPSCDDCEATAEFDFIPAENLPFGIQFENLSSLIDACDFTNYTWIFGDGRSSNEPNPIHQYASEGTYNVCLISDFEANETLECLTAICDMITVEPPITCEDCALEPAFTFQQENLTSLEINFNNESNISNTCDFTSFNWAFGDGEQSSDKNPIHQYNAAGSYNVCLSIEYDNPNQQPCSFNFCDSIVVKEAITCNDCISPQFSYQVNDSISNIINFRNDTKVGDDCGITALNWDFGDGQQSEESFPSNQYEEAGSYHVCLNLNYTVLSELECATQICDSLVVEKPHVCEDCQIESAFSFQADEEDTHQIYFGSEVNINESCEILSYSWNFGDGQQSDEANPIHKYYEDGIYDVCLTVEYVSYEGLNCSSVICDLVTVERQIKCEDCMAVPAFSFESIPTQTGTYVFENESTINDLCSYTNLTWNFGDGQQSNEANTTHQYEKADTFEVCLSVEYLTPDTDCTLTVCETLVIEPFPTCEECEPIPDIDTVLIDIATIKFSDVSNIKYPCEKTLWHWDFGDGQQANEQNPTHTYAENGSYTVCLTLSFNRLDDLYCETQVCQTIEIGDIDACENCTTLADFDHEILEASKVKFFGDVSTKDDCIVNQTTWNFGDGQESTELNPIHQYEKPGDYNACMIVEFFTPDGIPCESLVCDTIVVPSCEDCVVEAGYSIEETSMSNTFEFINESIQDPNCPTTSVKWDFGDGQESTEQNTSHVYDTEGTFSVCLSVNFVAENKLNCQTIHCDSVIVKLPTCEDCDINPAVSHQNLDSLKVQFNNFTTINDSCEIVGFNWQFGDGQQSQIENPIHQYTKTDTTFQTCLTIEYFTAEGKACEAIVCDEIRVDQPTCDDCAIKPDYTFETAGTMDSNIIQFSNFSTISDSCEITEIKWIFGDGNTSNEENPIHEYQTEGVFTACLDISYTGGDLNCHASICDTLVIEILDCDDCEVSPKQTHEILDSFKVAFFDESNISSNCKIDSVLWDFGDGQTASEINPVHQYAKADSFQTCLKLFYTALDDLNCETLICESIKVPDVIGCETCDVKPGFLAADTANLTVQFQDASTISNSCIISSHNWQFGDGETSTEKNPQHTYTTEDDFSVCLTIKYDTPQVENCEAVICDTISVSIGCDFCQTQADFDFIESETSTTAFIFSDTTALNNDCKITAWNWDFGDGETSAEQNPEHDFADGGEFDVCLTVNFSTPTINDCASEQHCETVTVDVICTDIIDLGNQMLVNRNVSASGRVFSAGTVPENKHAVLSAEDFVELQAGFSVEKGAALSVLNEVCEKCASEQAFLNNIAQLDFGAFTPVADNISIEFLDEVTSCNENLRLEAEFSKIDSAFHVITVNDEKCVLRDDGKGADKVAGDKIFSIFMNEDLDRIDEILDLAKASVIAENEDFNEGLNNPENPNIFIDNDLLINRAEVIDPNAQDNDNSPEILSDIQIFSTADIDAAVNEGEAIQITLDQLLLGSEIADVNAEKTLMITDLSVIEDPTRTFNFCTGEGTPNGVWTFGHLMRQMSPNPNDDASVSEFVLNWLKTWENDNIVNGEEIKARSSIRDLVINPWLENSGGNQLKMEFAPFRLMAIVNRFDLRDNSEPDFNNAGEGRFVFCVINSNCFAEQFTVIFEFGVNKNTCESLNAYANEWGELNDLAFDSDVFNTQLEAITKQFTEKDTNPNKVNGSSLNQLRTNEIALDIPWELREFKLTENGLELDPVKMEPAVKYNSKAPNDPNVALLVDFINNHVPPIRNNSYEVPLSHNGEPFLGGKSHSEITHWDGASNSPGFEINNPLDRHVFSLNTCSGCHGGETNTFFTHIDPSTFGSEINLSGFLTGLGDGNNNDNRLTVDDPTGNGLQFQFNDLRRREVDLDVFLATDCDKFKLLELVYKISVPPLNMVH